MVQSRANTPLSDVTVLDFGQIFQGPYASFLMAKAGAFVIKIEPPRGEPGRRHPVRAMDLTRHILPAARAHAIHQPERSAVLGDPFLAPRAVGYVRHTVLVCGAGVAGEEIRRQPDQIEVTVGRDDVVFHLNVLRASLQLA